MNEPTKNPFDLLLDHTVLVAAEIAKALKERRPAKLNFDTREAADMP